MSAESFSSFSLRPPVEPTVPSPAVRRLRIGDLIAVRDFPAVIHGGDVRSLRFDDESDELRAAQSDFVGGYLGFDDRARHALGVLLAALARPESGGAFFVNGVFGSGKSHLLGLMALLADGIGHEDFKQTHGELASLLTAFYPRFVLHIALDEYDAAHFSLEDIFWKEARAGWIQSGFLIEELHLPDNASRAEKLMALQAALAARGLNGMLLCFDELSLFLAAREHHALQGDASFLQFLGQHARRHPLVVIGALQKTVEDVGELEAYSLSQIRDRYTLLPLSLAHLPSLIERRLIQKKDADALHKLNHATFENLTRALPRLDFGRQEWDALYPFYPSVVSLLEGAVSRFFSRTRSAVLFCAESIRLEAEATRRIGVDELFTYLEPEMDEHPDLRSLAGVWREWQAPARELTTDSHEAAHLRLLMQALLLFKIAGQAPTVVQLTNAAALDAGLPGEGDYEYVRVLLERLRTRIGFVAVERAEDAGDALADRYTIDLGLRIGEMARRHVRGVLETLDAQDARISHYVLACCRNHALPLAGLETNPTAPVLWRNTSRHFSITLLQNTSNAANLVNRVMALSQSGQEGEALLLIAPPFSSFVAQATALFDEVLRVLAQAETQAKTQHKTFDDARWRGALVLWTPRTPTRDEWETAREATAQHLLESDPQLLDNKRGRAILGHLKNGALQREAALAQIATRLLREGNIANGSGLAGEAGEILSGDSWASTLESIAEFVLPGVFPRFESVAPTLRVLTPSNAEALCLDILRRPANAPYFAPVLERAARAIAEPLGVARSEAGRWRISEGRGDLIKEVLHLCEGGAALTHIEATFAKSGWGLVAEQTHLAVCALLRSGQLVATDVRGQVLAPGQIGIPLSRSVRALRPGRLVSDEAWPRVRKLVALLSGEQLGALGFVEQRHARALLTAWRETALSETELAQARLHQLRRVCNQTTAQWPRSRAVWEVIESLLATLSADGPSAILERVAELNIETIEPALAEWRRILTRLDERHAPLLEAHAALTHPALSVPPGLQAERAKLLARFDAGEELLEDDELIADTKAWRAAYTAHYREWHEVQHAPARFAPYKKILASDNLRVLDKLAHLAARPFAQGTLVRSAAQNEWVKACLQSASLPPGDVVCPNCRLRWGERLSLRDPREIERIGDGALASLRLALRDKATHIRLQRSEKGRELLQWNEAGDGESESLLQLLDDETLNLLDAALRPRRQVSRSRQALLDALATCHTHREFREAFNQWLDAGETLTEQDEIELL
jgi:hypothetical protein